MFIHEYFDNCKRIYKQLIAFIYTTVVNKQMDSRMFSISVTLFYFYIFCDIKEAHKRVTLIRIFLYPLLNLII